MKDESQFNELENSIDRIANAITPIAVGYGTDAVGGHINSLTEAVMGITGAIARVAESHDNNVEAATIIADAINGLSKTLRGFQGANFSDVLSHGICMGIRHGLFGGDASDDTDIRDTIRIMVEEPIRVTQEEE